MQDYIHRLSLTGSRNRKANAATFVLIALLLLIAVGVGFSPQHHHAQGLHHDTDAFLSLYRQQGGRIANNNTPFLLSLEQAYGLMGGMPAESEHHSPILIVGGKHRFLLTQVNETVCDDLMSTVTQSVPVFTDPVKAFSHIGASDGDEAACVRLHWVDGISPLYALLNYSAMPEQISSFLYYQRLPPPKNISEPKSNEV